MGCYTKTFVLTIVLILGLQQQLWALRPLGEEQRLYKNLIIQFQTLPRGPVKPSQKNPCSTIPGRSPGGHCTLSQINVAGNVIFHPLHHHPSHLRPKNKAQVL